MTELSDAIRHMTEREQANQAAPFNPTAYDLPDGDWEPLVNPITPEPQRNWLVIRGLLALLVIVGVVLLVAGMGR